MHHTHSAGVDVAEGVRCDEGGGHAGRGSEWREARHIADNCASYPRPVDTSRITFRVIRFICVLS